MKKIILITCVSLFSVIGCAHANTSVDEAPAAAKKSPFYGMYPTDLAPAAESYFGEWNKVLFKKPYWVWFIDLKKRLKQRKLYAYMRRATISIVWAGIIDKLSEN